MYCAVELFLWKAIKINNISRLRTFNKQHYQAHGPHHILGTHTRGEDGGSLALRWLRPHAATYVLMKITSAEKLLFLVRQLFGKAAVRKCGLHLYPYTLAWPGLRPAGVELPKRMTGAGNVWQLAARPVCQARLGLLWIVSAWKLWPNRSMWNALAQLRLLHGAEIPWGRISNSSSSQAWKWPETLKINLNCTFLA